jgi:hypothetical protein
VTFGEQGGARYQVRFAEPQDRELVARFNERVAAGGIDYQYPLDWRLPGEPANGEGGPAFRKLLLIEDGQQMRAGVILHHTTLFVRGAERPFCWSLLPISEGTIDRAHSLAMLILMKHALEYQPFLTGLGVGSMDEDAAQFLVRLRWRHETVPFLFYPVRPARLLNGLEYVRRRQALHIAGRAAAYTGAASALGWGWDRRRRRRARRLDFEASVEPSFGPWADDLFRRHRGEYGAVVRRDAAAMNVVYPEGDPRYARIRVREGRSGTDVGWVVVIHKQMEGDEYFGDLRVGTLIDGFGPAAETGRLVAAGLAHLIDAGVDVAVANWSHRAWVEASRSLGFLGGPSNFFFFVSPEGSPLLENGCPLPEIHLGRGDGDGPGRLLPGGSGPATP